MKRLLDHPAFYQLYQELGGFFGARVSAMRDYLTIGAGDRIIDIGCGPGHILRHLPAGVDYVGLDVDPKSIAYAKAHYGTRGQFHARFFDTISAEELGPADLVMMNGVIHHMGDREVAATLVNIRYALKPGGVLLTLDGCYAPGQSRLAKWLLDNDRGAHVRSAERYGVLLKAVFDRVEMHFRDDYSRLPYTFAIGVARNHG